MKSRHQVRIKIYGRVQGVGFRNHLSREAGRNGVAGWVKNHSDGSVEALFQGNRVNLEHMIQWCMEGPSRAKVTDHEISWEKPEELYSSFKIRV